MPKRDRKGWVRFFTVWLCAAALAPLPARAQAPAREAGKAAPESKRERARTLFLNARKQYKLGRFGEALSLFSKAYEVMPLPGFLYNIAQCHRFIGNYTKAVFFYKSYLRDNHGAPNTPVVQKLIKQCQDRLQSESRNRTSARRLFDEARKHFRLGQYNKAAALFARAYKVFAVPSCLFHLGETHLKLGQYKKAVEFYKGYAKDNLGTPNDLVQKRISECKKLQAEKERRQRELAGKAMLPGHARAGAGTGGPMDSGGRVKKRRPFYKRWWFWTAVSAGVVAAAVTGLAVGLTRNRDSGGWDRPSHDWFLDWRN